LQLCLRGVDNHSKHPQNKANMAIAEMKLTAFTTAFEQVTLVVVA
jgi:hypothetical protein